MLSNDECVEIANLNKFLNIIFRNSNQSTNDEDELKQKLCKLNSSIEELDKNSSKWESSFGMNDQQRLRCLFIHNLYKHALIECDEFSVLSKNYPKKNNFKTFFEYALKYGSDQDNFVVIDGEPISYKDKLTDFDWVKREVYKLAFFRALMKEGDIILLKKSENHNQRLAIFKALGNRCVPFYEFQKTRLRKNVFHSFLNSNLDDEKIEFIQLDQENDDNNQLDWFNLKINLVIKFGEIKAKHWFPNEASFLETLDHNLRVVDTLSNGDIIKLEGTKLFNVAIYHHAALITNIDEFEIIHKSGEPTGSSNLITLSQVIRENLLNECLKRLIFKNNEFDGVHNVRPVHEIIEMAESQLGNTEYNLLVDNCQHFCTYCRYDIRKSSEICNVTMGLLK